MDGERFSDAPGITAPYDWLVVFQRTSSVPWVNRFCPGEHKHVLAVGWVPASRSWLWVNPTMAGLDLRVIVEGDEDGLKIVSKAMEDATVVRVLSRTCTREDPRRPFFRSWCVPLVARAVNVRSGAVTPDGLLRDCLATEGSMVLDNDLRPAAGRPVGEGAAPGG